uniref:RRM domain-containing protein n=1 Tax=Oryza barthii TaxID=65489 RepID=A0A0D3F2K8_9ORYZ
MAGYPEENQHGMNGYEEEEEVEEVEGFDEEGRPGRRGGGGRDGGDGGAYGDAGGDDGRAPGGDSSGSVASWLGLGILGGRFSSEASLGRQPKVEVKRTVPREEMSSKDGPKTRKIFVGGLPSSLTEEGRMRDLGGKQVEIKKAEPKKHGGDHSSNGRSSHGSGGGYRSSYRSGGAAASGGGGGGGGGGSGSSGGYGYGAGYRSAGGEEGMAMEVMLDLDQDMVVVMVAPCMEVPMVLMGHMVVVPMEGVPMAEVLMVVVPMVALRVPMVVLEDMAVMVELEQEVLVGGVPAGTIHMGNE